LPVHGAGEFEVLTDAPTEMSLEERLFLYALVRGTKPTSVLEIGTAQGGSTMIIAAALEESGDGRIFSIDPAPRTEPDDPRYRGRLVQLEAPSPEAVHEAARIAGAPFDFALLDGIHIYKQTAIDLAAVLLHLADRAYVLLHDSFHFGVSEAIREALAADPALIDCGYVSGTPRPVGDLCTHAGFRLLRRGAEVDDPTPLVEPLWESLGRPMPHDRALIDHDFWYCEAIEPCDYCKAASAHDT
jgi:hypothetical protein